MTVEISTHQHMPTLGNPGRCGSCAQAWDHQIHNPDHDPKYGPAAARRYVRLKTVGEVAPMPDSTPLPPEQPKCPKSGCPDTHPHLHSRADLDANEDDLRKTVDAQEAEIKKLRDVVREATDREQTAFSDAVHRSINPAVRRDQGPVPEWVDNTDVVTPAHVFVIKSVKHMADRSIENADYCSYCDRLFDSQEVHPNFTGFRCAYHKGCADLMFFRPSALADHALKVHGQDEWEVMEYLQDPWMMGESRADWKTRTFRHRYGVSPDKVTAQVTPTPEVVRGALRAFAAGLRSVAPAAAHEAAGDPTEARDEPTFRDWWVDWVEDAAPTIQRKAAEYGSNSLAEMGRTFARAQGRNQIEDHEALEIGCMFYAKGKIERVLDAMLQGRLPSADTWGDLMVYAAMASYIREFKRWP